MRIAIVAGVAILLGGCTPVRMAGFDTIAATGDRIDLTGIPGWQDGRFRLGGSEGHVRRRALGATREWRDDPWGEVSQAVVEHTSTLAFDIAGAEAGGRIEGRCRYGRVEAQDRIGPLGISETIRPLRLACAYRVDGRDAGGMDLATVMPPAATIAEPRIGTVELDGIRLSVASGHRGEGLRLPLEGAIGYVVTRADGTPVGAIETNGVGPRRLVVPRAPGDRRAALAAIVTLALFWDPGDMD